MTALLLPHPQVTLAPFAAVAATLSAMRTRHGAAATHGIHPGLVVADPRGWTPATWLTDGTLLPALLAAAGRRWSAQPPAAAALAWKSYTYWVALPAVLSYATGRRVPLVSADNMLVRFHDHQPFLTVGFRASTLTAVLPTDPVPGAHRPGAEVPDEPALPGAVVVPDEPALLGAFREALLDRHLDPLLAQIQSIVRLGSRTLLGSVASGVAYGVAQAAYALPGSAIETANTLLDALGVADLVDLTETGDGRLSVHRRTCCLAFTLPEPKICSGCVLR